jgi:hypothetical protein
VESVDCAIKEFFGCSLDMALCQSCPAYIHIPLRHVTKTYFDCTLFAVLRSALGKAVCRKKILYISFSVTDTTTTTTTTTEVFKLHFHELEFSGSSLESVHVTILCSSQHLSVFHCFSVCFLKIGLMVNFTYININIHTYTYTYRAI